MSDTEFVNHIVLEAIEGFAEAVQGRAVDLDNFEDAFYATLADWRDALQDEDA